MTFFTHTLAAFFYPYQNMSAHRAKRDIGEVLPFAAAGRSNTTGTLILLFVAGMLITSMPLI
jgi:hypothetical protein